jgi:hypothetical protein
LRVIRSAFRRVFVHPSRPRANRMTARHDVM